jgi:hypothetical protein
MPSRKITDLNQIGSISDDDLLLIRELIAGFDRNMTVSQLAAKLTAVKTTVLSVTGYINSSTTLSVVSSGANYTKSGDSGNLKTASEFLNLEYIQVFLNGVALTKGVDVIWVSSTSFNLSTDIDVGDKILILS